MPISVPWQAICIVEDTCDMAKKLNPMAFSWINHEANLATHYLAKWVLNNSWQGFVNE